MLDEHGKPLLGGDHDLQVLEASWMFRRNGLYYFTIRLAIRTFSHTPQAHILKAPFSTGDIFCYQCRVGLTSLHRRGLMENGGSSMQIRSFPSKNHLRNVKVTELHFNADGSIQTVDPFISN